jgi:HD-GYP domain-containing protein (c-di-GMP phosphodiesterase class II)
MNYIPVRIGTLRPWEAVNFDVFIKINDRYLHYIRKSDPFDGDRIGSLKAKGVKKLFIPDASEQDYLAYLDRGLDQLKDTQLTLSDRAVIARDSVMTAAESVAKNVQSESGFKKTEDQVEKVLSFLTAENGAMKEVLASSGVASDLYHHTTHVITLSLSVAARLGGMDSKTLMNLGIAALLHDTGKESLSLDPSTPREQLSDEQAKLYWTHMDAALDKIQTKPYINGHILALIADHEEIGEGVGPKKKRLKTLPVAQQILNMCNEYDRICTVNKVSPLEAIKQFYLEKMGLFDLGHLKLLSEVIRA